MRNRLPLSYLVILIKVAGFVKYKDKKLSKLFGSQELRVWDGFQLLPLVDWSEPPLGKGPQKDSYLDFSLKACCLKNLHSNHPEKGSLNR